MKFKLTLQQAKGCLHFLKNMTAQINEGNFDTGTLGLPEEQIDQFIGELKGFTSYMNLMVKSEISEIKIPERYHRIYKAMTLGMIGQIVMRNRD